MGGRFNVTWDHVLGGHAIKTRNPFGCFGGRSARYVGRKTSPKDIGSMEKGSAYDAEGS
jgi:hypothetical protein